MAGNNDPKTEARAFRFAVDAMLGRLARWLRLAGLDTFYEADVPDEVLLARAVKERRILITRDRALARRALRWKIRVIIPSHDGGWNQLREICNELGLEPENLPWFDRCTQCNVLVVPVEKDRVRLLVPRRVWLSHQEFFRCPECGKIFWPGSHVQAVERVRNTGTNQDQASSPRIKEQ